MTNQDFDRLVNSIRDDAPDAETARAAADRVRERLGAGSTNSAPNFVPISKRIAGPAGRGPKNAGRRPSAFLRGLPPRILGREKLCC